MDTERGRIAPDVMLTDPAAEQADDALLDALGAGCAPDGADGQPAPVLTAWRSTVHADSIRELVDTDTALALASAARRPPRRRAADAAALTAAAVVFAVLAVVFAVLGLVSYDSGPGDLLYPLRELLYTQEGAR